MLNKMRRRFILAAMSAFSCVILVLLLVINLSYYKSITDQQDETLFLLAQLNKQSPFDRYDIFSAESSYMIRYFSVTFDESLNPININHDFIASVSVSQAEQYAIYALNCGKTAGYYNGYRFLSVDSFHGTTIFFLNSEKELQSFTYLAWTTVTIAALCLAVVFLLVVVFSKHAIAPYARNMRAQKQFITNASHELKTPLTAISASADILAMEYADDEWVKNVRSQTVKLAKLITNLITLSRLNEDNPFPSKIAFSLSDTLWEVCDSFIATANAMGKKFTYSIPDELALNGDRTAISQLFSILLDNALKYSPDNGFINLNAKRSGKHTEITIENNCSCPPKDVSRLFERFYRADESHSGNTVGGTGIGLSIAKATVEAHGGSIDVRQTDDVICFCVRF